MWSRERFKISHLLTDGFESVVSSRVTGVGDSRIVARILFEQGSYSQVSCNNIGLNACGSYVLVVKELAYARFTCFSYIKTGRCEGGLHTHREKCNSIARPFYPCMLFFQLWHDKANHVFKTKEELARALDEKLVCPTNIQNSHESVKAYRFVRVRAPKKNVGLLSSAYEREGAPFEIEINAQSAVECKVQCTFTPGGWSRTELGTWWPDEIIVI